MSAEKRLLFAAVYALIACGHYWSDVAADSPSERFGSALIWPVSIGAVLERETRRPGIWGFCRDRRNQGRDSRSRSRRPQGEQ